MRILYNAIYLLLLAFGLPWIAWRIVVQRKNRSGWRQKLFGLVARRTDNRPCIWFHAVSVGEVNLLPKLVNRLKAERSELSIAISSTTETGLKLAKDLFPDDHVFFCPSDFSWAVSNTLNRLQPDMLVLTELEIWPNLIAITTHRDIPVVLINGRISENSFRGYERIRFLIEPIAKQIKLACVQTIDYGNRLVKLGTPREKILLSGNIKFDNAISKSAGDEKALNLKTIANFDSGDFVFVAGSTLETEDLMLLEMFDSLHQRNPDLRLVLVPRHPSRVHRIEDALRRRGLKYVLRSELNSENIRNTTDHILIVDVIGELALWWQLADAGFVGGTMGNRGGQNMIEPAAAGVPVSFGPDTVNFKDVVRLLLDQHAAKRVHNKEELQRFVEWSMTQSDEVTAMAERAQQTVMTQRGALETTMNAVLHVFDQRINRSSCRDSRNAA